MAFVLNEAVVKIKSSGIPKLKQDLASVHSLLAKIGTGTAAKGLNADFRNATRSVSMFNVQVKKAHDGLRDLPSGPKGGFLK